VLLLLRFLIRIPDYIFRKLLHIVAFTSILPLVLGTDIWWIAVLVEIIFLIIVVFALHFFEHFTFYSALFVEKGRHEVITSFILLFGMITAMLAVFWGGLGDHYSYIAVAALMAWGPGDAAAAIIGHKYGKHHLSGKWIEGVKSVEGTIAMGITSFLCTFVTLYFLSGFPLIQILGLCLIIAPVSAFVELISHNGNDTASVAGSLCIVLSILTAILH
jgi:dolichol kinase